MERYQELRDKAKATIHKADHMLTMSYPLLNEPKILVSVANSVMRGCDYAMTSLLEHERLFKRIPQYPDNFDSKLLIFRDKIVPKYKINISHVKLVMELKEIAKAHSSSAVEFSKDKKYVMASEDYELRTLTSNDLKKLILKAKLFVDEMQRLTQQNDGIFR
jgi:hypothetical protein